MAGIFISYRRDDSAAWAGRLYDLLTDRFGEPHVFMDIDDIGPGEDFREAIEHTLGQCDVLLAVIGPDWLASVDQLGARRIDKPNDYLRMEIARALSEDDRVIPILVGGAEMPSEEYLPASLTSLAYRQAMELTPNHFRRDVQVLGDAIEELRHAETPLPAETFAATIAALPDPPSWPPSTSSGEAPQTTATPPPSRLPSRTVPVPATAPVGSPRATRRQSRSWLVVIFVVVLAGLGLAALMFRASEDAGPGTPISTEPAADNRGTDAPPNGGANEEALASLNRQVSDDSGTVEGILDQWVPQLSAKQSGMEWEGVHYQYPEILAEHEELRSRYPVALVEGGSYNFRIDDQPMTGWYITLAAVPFPTADGALEWCRAESIDRDNCFAKLISREVMDGTRVLQ